MDKHELFEEYAPYHLMTAFKVGFEADLHSPGPWRPTPHQGDPLAMTDQELEAGTRRQRFLHRLAKQ